jgi:hypothetical protein
MRRAILAVSVLCLAELLASAQGPEAPKAETKLTAAEVRVETEVRAGPSPKYPSTGILRRGAKVLIKRATENDFLEIVPPEGSVSWIQKFAIAPFGPVIGERQAFRVVGDGDKKAVMVLPGSLETKGPLEIIGKKGTEVAPGMQGYLRGQPVKPAWDNQQWVPILPMPGESRFIAKAALQDPPSGSSPAIASAKKPAFDSSLDGLPGSELYKRAEQAERDGNIDLAIDLYNRVTKQESARNFDLANRAATKVFELSRSRATRPPGSLVSRSGSNATGNAPPAQAASLKPNLSAAPNNNQRSSGVGWLRKTGFQIDDKPSYALMDANRRIMFYVTGEPGVNLSPYLERWVELFGTTEVRGDVRGADYMRVSRVTLVR